VLSEKLDRLLGQPMVSDDPAAISRAIKARFDLSLAEMRFKKKMLDDLEKGILNADAPPAADEGGERYGVIWQAQVLDVIKSKGLTPLLLARDGVQLFNVGWLADRDPRESAPPGRARPPATIRNCVLIHKDELMQLYLFLKNVVERWNAALPVLAWKGALNSVTGNELVVRESDTPADVTALYLGVRARSGILQLTFDEITRLDAARRAELRDQLELKCLQLNDVLEEEAANYEGAFEEGKRVWKRTYLGVRKYWDRKRAWIDRDLLP
jgi:hypothetical protein